MNRALWVIATTFLVFLGCQELPTEPVPIDLSQEQPIAVPDTAFTDEDAKVTINVLLNDSSLVGDELKVTEISEDPTEGLAEIATNKVVYTPSLNFSGIDSLSYVVSGSVLSSSAPIYVIVRPVNDPPVASNDEFQVSETAFASKTYSDLDVLANDTDIDGDRLSVLRTTNPVNGQIEIPDGGATVRYTPDADFVGSDSFRYTIQDGNGGLDVADVMITVVQSNDAPVAANDSWAVREDEQLIVAAPGVLQNDVDQEQDLLSAVLFQDVEHGILLLAADGSFTYQPDADYAGSDRFEYVASDGVTESNVATVSITVLTVNDRPVALADTFRVKEDAELNATPPGVLANDFEPEGTVLTARLLSNVTNGNLILSPNGSFTYVGAPDFNGIDSFTYRATDGSAESDPTEVVIVVSPVNDVPVASVDAYETNEDESLAIPAPGVLTNDFDIDGDELTSSLQSLPANGTISLLPDGSFLYVPTQDFAGLDGFTYAVNDGQASNIAAVSLKVTSRNDPPIARSDNYETPANTELVVSMPGLLQNDTDVENDRLSAELVSEPQHGGLFLNADGSFRYTPDMAFVGEDTFLYQAVDATLQSETALVTIRTTAVGRPPVAADDFFNAYSDTVLVVEAPGILSNDADNDQDLLTAILVVDVSVGTLELLADGSFSYTAEPEFTGLVTFAYRATDGNNVSNVAIVQLTVQ